MRASKKLGWWGRCAGGDEAAGGVVDLEVEAGEVVVGDGVAVDLDALVDADEVGRGVEAGAVAGGGEDAGERGGGGAFAVGSGDEDGGEGGLGVAERCGEDAHVGEVELAAGRSGRGGGEFVAEGVEMVDRCDVGHGGILGEVSISARCDADGAAAIPQTWQRMDGSGI